MKEDNELQFSISLHITCASSFPCSLPSSSSSPLPRLLSRLVIARRQCVCCRSLKTRPLATLLSGRCFADSCSSKVPLPTRSGG